MPRINLLPWRDTLKKERETRFGTIAGASLFVCGIVVLTVHLYMSSEIDYQESRNKYLTSEIDEANAKIKKIKELGEKRQGLIDRMGVIQELEESRPQIVHVFEELVKQVPDGVYFKSLKQKDNKFTIEGIAQSDARVSSLMKKFEESEWLSNPKIIYIKLIDKKHKKGKSDFKLEIKHTTPSKKESSS
jgi:type IV pilus assembly protein PilN